MSLALDDLQELLWSFAAHRVITVAGRTGVLAHLANRSDTPQGVAAALGLDPLAAGKVLRALTALGLLERAEGGYRVTPSLGPCFEPGPEAITPFLEHSHAMYERWGENLEPWLRGEPWTTKRRGASETRTFGAAMRAMGAQVAPLVAAALDLDGVRRILDIGGGFGHYARALCAARPGISATILDRPEVVELAREELRGTEWEGRLAFVAGDFLQTDYGAGYDLVLLANVLHQERDGSAADLVRRGAAALSPGGRLAVVDWSIDDEQQAQLLGALFAINMRSFGDTHPEPRIRGWMKRAGLERVERVDLGRHRWLIVGRRPG